MKKLRYAFTFIELIFSIVIIGVAVISLPIINQQISRGIENNLAQEAVMLASADVVRAMSGQWDENSRVDNFDFEYIVFTNDAEVTLADGNTTRPGYINIPYHQDNTLRPTSGADTGDTEPDDIDDYITSTDNAIDSSGSSENFKDQYTKTISVVSPASFGSLGSNLNFKQITIQYAKSNTEPLVQLHMYVANTGSSSSPSRELQ